MKDEASAMERLLIEATRSTPYILFDPDADLLQMKGESYPENAAKFFAPLFSWMDKYLSSRGARQITVDLELHYFNSSSSKALMNFLAVLERAVGLGHQVIVNWRHHEENELAIECGEEFREDAPSLTFRFIPFGG